VNVFIGTQCIWTSRGIKFSACPSDSVCVRVRAKEASFDCLAVDLCSGFYILFYIGADFHGAMVATAPREKLFIRRRPPPVMNWTRRRISSLFLCRKLHLFLGKSTKTAATQLHFLTPICTKSFVGWGFWEAYSVPQTHSCI